MAIQPTLPMTRRQAGTLLGISFPHLAIAVLIGAALLIPGAVEAQLNVVMNRYDKIESHMVGKIDHTSSMYEEYNRDLLAVEEDQFAKWIRLKPR